MSRNKCFFLRFEFHMFYVSYPFVTYLLTLPRCCTVTCRNVVSNMILNMFFVVFHKSVKAEVRPVCARPFNSDILLLLSFPNNLYLKLRHIF
jgi:hypothetical protein